MSVFEKAVTEVRQGQEAFHNNLNNTNNSPPERDITYFNRTLVSTYLLRNFEVHTTRDQKERIVK